MKKIITIVAGLAITSALAIAVASYQNTCPFFYRNINALTRISTIFGDCGEKDGECIIACPNCLELLYAAGHKGPASNLRGVCPACRQQIGQ